MNFTDHPLTVDFSITLLKVRRFFNTKEIFAKMFEAVLTKLETILKKF